MPWPAFFAFLEFFLVGGCKARSSFQPTRPMVTNTSPRSSSPPWGGGWHHTYFAGTQTDAETTDSTLMQRKHIIFALSFPTHVCTAPARPFTPSARPHPGDGYVLPRSHPGGVRGRGGRPRPRPARAAAEDADEVRRPLQRGPPLPPRPASTPPRDRMQQPGEGGRAPCMFFLRMQENAYPKVSVSISAAVC